MSCIAVLYVYQTCHVLDGCFHGTNTASTHVMAVVFVGFVDYCFCTAECILLYDRSLGSFVFCCFSLPESVLGFVVEGPWP